MIDIVDIIVMLIVGIGGGFISGMVGIGGSIIIYPAILLLPPLFGAPSYSTYIASGLTSSQVFFSTLSGSLRARKEPDFSPQLVINMGGRDVNWEYHWRDRCPIFERNLCEYRLYCFSHHRFSFIILQSNTS